MAKQGNIKAWHFAHTTGAECAGGPMTALHLAAQHLIQRVGKLRVPALVAQATATSASGELLQESVVKPSELLIFDEVSLEVNLGDIRPDVVGTNPTASYFIEVAVTHFVDEQKHGKLKQHDVPTVEIDLSNVTASDWDSLYTAVIDSVELKQWVHHPAWADMQRQAEAALRARLAAAEAASDVMEQPQSKFSQAEWSRTYRFNRACVYVDGFNHYIRIHQTNFVCSETFSAMNALIRRLGGCATGDRYWKVPMRAKESLLDGLGNIFSTVRSHT
ncbi:hypothetical protein [Chitinimonas naiadis]